MSASPRKQPGQMGSTTRSRRTEPISPRQPTAPADRCRERAQTQRATRGADDARLLTHCRIFCRAASLRVLKGARIRSVVWYGVKLCPGPTPSPHSPQPPGCMLRRFAITPAAELVTEPPRPIGSIRRYTEADADRLRFIKRAQAMGFTLAEITSLITLQARRSCRATRELAATKLRLIDARICELRDLRKELAGLIAD